MPVYAFVEDVAASGGYWLACAADEIWADDSSIVGSIGVISAGFGAHELHRPAGHRAAGLYRRQIEIACSIRSAPKSPRMWRGCKAIGWTRSTRTSSPM